MKVRSFRAPRLLMGTVAQARGVLRGFGYLVCTNKLLSLGFFAVALAFGSAVFPHDVELLQGLHFWNDTQEKTARSIAWFLGTWGDYPTYNLPLALLIWLYGAWRKSSTWRRIAVVCLLGATLAGLFDDFFRLTLGRPRPDAHMPDGFYGITYAFSGGFQSFPSGHAAAVFGASIALLAVHRPLGLLTTAFAFAVVWARMELYRHYPSDVIVGSIFGLYFGFMVGSGARLLRSRPLGAAPSSVPPDFEGKKLQPSTK